MDLGRLRSSTLKASSSRGLGGLGSLYTFVGIGDGGDASVGSSTGAATDVNAGSVSSTGAAAGLLLRGGIVCLCVEVGCYQCGGITGGVICEGVGNCVGAPTIVRP